MQRLASEFIGRAVYSVHSADQIGIIKSLLVRESDLKVELIVVVTLSSTQGSYLLPSDIRFENSKKIIINSHHDLSEAEDLLRYKQSIQKPFLLLGCKVVTQTGKKLGKVRDYSLDTQHFFINKIHVSNLWGTLISDKLIIARSDIVDVDRAKVTVRDGVVKIKKANAKPLPATK